MTGVQTCALPIYSKLTTYANLTRLDKMQIEFITLRRRSPKLLEEVYGLSRSAWRTVELDVPTRQYRNPRVFEQQVSLAGGKFRQLFVLDLGHEEPTILLSSLDEDFLPDVDLTHGSLTYTVVTGEVLANYEAITQPN